MKHKYQKRKVEYVDGYDQYDKYRTIPVTFFLNEAEKCFLDDLMAVMSVRNMSAFIRSQVFHAYQTLTDEQKEQMREIAQWRASEETPIHNS